MASAKKAVEEVKNRSQQQPNQGANRASQSGGNAAGSGNNIAEEMGKKLGNQMTGQVMYHAMKTLENNLATGNYGELFEQFMDSFNNGFDASLNQNNLLIQEELDPKYLLQSSSTSSNTLNDSQENSVTITVETA